jgi:hypothetical protein
LTGSTFFSTTEAGLFVADGWPEVPPQPLVAIIPNRMASDGKKLFELSDI